MEAYIARRIEFGELVKVGEWSIKIYTVAKESEFGHPVFYDAVKRQLPTWLAMKNGFSDSNDKIGFLILHQGKEGIFSIVNWWVGENMLNTHVFISNPEQTRDFTRVSGNGLGPCVWEFEVINHERMAWIEHVLKRAPSPNYDAYLSDVFNGTI